MYTLYLLDRYDLAAVVGAAGQAGMVRLFYLLALRADREVRRLEELVRTSLVPAGLGCFVFWIRHFAECSFYFLNKSFNFEKGLKSS
jgi:hypothetical protein